MSKSYWIRVGDRTQGPFTGEQLRGFAAAGKLQRQHQVSADQQSWTHAGKIGGLDFPSPLEKATRDESPTEEPKPQGSETPQTVRPKIDYSRNHPHAKRTFEQPCDIDLTNSQRVTKGKINTNRGILLSGFGFLLMIFSMLIPAALSAATAASAMRAGSSAAEAATSGQPGSINFILGIITLIGLLAGVILFFWGIIRGTIDKGYGVALGSVLAVFGVIGLLILLLLPDKNPNRVT